MTWHHVFIISSALLVLAFCGHTAECHDLMPQLATVSGMAIGGAIGHANSATKLRRKTTKHKTLEQPDDER